jgi:hypothetical protein
VEPEFLSQNLKPYTTVSSTLHRCFWQLKDPTSFGRSRRRSTSSLSAGDALEVPRTEPKEWRRVPPLPVVSWLGAWPAVKEPRVMIHFPSAPFWARKPMPSCPVAPGVEHQRGRHRLWHAAIRHATTIRHATPEPSIVRSRATIRSQIPLRLY